MNHLNLAKMFLREEGANTDVGYALAGITHTLIAIAEELEKQTTLINVYQGCIISELPKIAEQEAEQSEAQYKIADNLERIAEQLKRFNDKLHVHEECLKVLVHDGDK